MPPAFGFLAAHAYGDGDAWGSTIASAEQAASAIVG